MKAVIFLMKWYIPDCYWHSKSNGEFVSHEAVCILNTSASDITFSLTLYFEDRDKVGGYSATVPAERTLHIRLDKTVSVEGIPIPQDTPYAMVIECEGDHSNDVFVQYTRVDSSQPDLAIATTLL